MAKHEFGVIDFFEENKWYSEYEPLKYDCISVDDDLVEEILLNYDKEFMKVKTYFQITTQPGHGLDYTGVTLIPQNSLKQFCDIITKANSQYRSRELELLIGKISDAMNENKYLIHYGI